MTPDLQLATPDDLTQMQALFERTIRETCKNDYSKEQIEVWVKAKDNTAHWLRKVNEQYFLLAKKDGLLIGMGSLAGNDYVDLMYVHPNYLRQGVARKLFQALLKRAEKKGANQLHVDASATAVPFFEQVGFVKVKKNQLHIEGVQLNNFRMIRRHSENTLK